MDTMETIRELEPKMLWHYFADLNAIPRASKKEALAVAFVRSFGEKHGLQTLVDQGGNVILKKPATPGREQHPTVILQGHLDMVHQKNAGTAFDFDTEGIRSYVDGDWVKAQGTTLGADNGIGVASILAVLASKDLVHPPLEALFTVDEETGMSGAQNLGEGLLNGKILLNLDSEEDDELTIGCAGGLDAFSEMSYTELPTPASSVAFLIKVSGLKGGHSGVDIHLGRANANKILIRLLYNEHTTLHLASFNGGNLRNAIPREAEAVVVIAQGGEEAFQSAFAERAAAITQEFLHVEPDMKLEATPCALPVSVMDPVQQGNILKALYVVPNGVYRMSPSIPGLVETSNNLARVEIVGGLFATQCLQRSSVTSGIQDIAFAVRAALELAGAQVTHSGGYPGWAPNPDSAVLKLVVSVYEGLFGQAPKVAACHAGLECGIIGNHYPGLDMVSLGPTIRHPHSPDEKVQVSSVQKFWRYLTAILGQI